MKHFSKAILAFTLTVFILSGCKKDQVEQIASGGSSKDGSSTSALRTIYVSGNWGDDNSANPFSSNSPLRTLQAASDITLPGDDVMIMNGLYTQPATADPNHVILKITRSGTSANRITYKGYPGHTPQLFSAGKKWTALVVNASYINIVGLDLAGNNSNISLSAAKAAEAEYRAGGRDWTKLSQFNTSGISMGTEGTDVHHIEVRNCKVHDFPAGGIGGGADYVTIDGNTVYNNGWFTMYGTSGISSLTPWNYDAGTGYKLRITRNTVYGNKTQVPYFNSPSGAISDGNGIIVDINRGYTGKTLVENNICYLNGGGGVHIFLANNVDVFSNTTYMNEQVLPYGNIDANQCTNVRFRNNIAYAKNGGKANDFFLGTNITFDYNLYYNGTVKANGANNIVGNPNFSNAPGGNFWLNPGSAALNAGTPTNPSATTIDYFWSARIKGGRIDIGAIEVQ